MRINERIVRFPTKYLSKAREYMKAVNDLCEKVKAEGRISTYCDFDNFVGHSGANYFQVIGTYNGMDDPFDFYVEFAADGTYVMICQMGGCGDSVAEWAGNFNEDFEIDFYEAISLNWT